MSDNFIPIVSNTPPPIDDGDFDYDFTEFAGASNHHSESDDDFGDFSGPLPANSEESINSPWKTPCSDLQFHSIVDKSSSDAFQCNGGIKLTSAHYNDSKGLVDKQEANCFEASFERCTASESSCTTDKERTVMDDADSTLGEENLVDDTVNPPCDISLASDTIETRDALVKENLQMFDVEEEKIDQSLQDSYPVIPNCTTFTSPITQIGSSNIMCSSNVTDPQSVDSISVVSDENFDSNGAVLKPSFSESQFSECDTPDVPFKKEVISPDTELVSENLPNRSQTLNNDFSTAFKNDDGTQSSKSQNSDVTKENTSNTKQFLSEQANLCLRENDEFSDFEHGFMSGKLNDSKTQLSIESNEQLPSNNAIENDHCDTFSAFDEKDKCKQSVINDALKNKFSEKSKSEEGKERDEESDDFADFTSFTEPAAVPSSDACSLHNNHFSSKTFETSETPAESEEFADFEQSNDFADFSDNNFAAFQGANDGGEDDFGDFSKVSSPPVFEQSVPNKPIPKTFSVTEEISKVSKWFASKTAEDSTDLEPCQIHCHVEDNIIPLYRDTQSPSRSTLNTSNKLLQRPTELWDSLEDVDNAIALRFRWNSSCNHQKLLSSLGVKTQNVFFSGESAPYYVPTYYAAGLGLLLPDTEATKPMSAADKITAASPTDKTSKSIDEGVLWTIQTDHAACDAIHGGVMMPIGGGLDTSSLNLDIFDVPTSKSPDISIAEQDKLDPELLELAMTVTPDATPSKRADPLSKILATLKGSSSKKVETEEELSAEASRIITKLPDLSYMRSHVLMFPVGQSSTLTNR